MEVFRVAREAYKTDLSGTGARINGGRWNSPGKAVLYTSENRSLAILETLVHITSRTVTSDLWMATLDIPESVRIDHLNVVKLPSNWNRFRAPLEVVQIGNRWLSEGKTLGLRVPSVLAEQESNILLNPHHPEMDQVEITDVRRLRVDGRLLRPLNRL